MAEENSSTEDRMKKTTNHRDGTVTYWSVYQQQWVRHTDSVPDQEFAAMNEGERNRTMRHLGVA